MKNDEIMKPVDFAWLERSLKTPPKSCNNCKYGYWSSSINWDWCGNKKACIAHLKEDLKEKELDYDKLCEEYPNVFEDPARRKLDINPNNDCLYYKRLWWKVWVK